MIAQSILAVALVAAVNAASIPSAALEARAVGDSSSGWTSVGCYQDKNQGHLLNDYSTTSWTLTVESCQSTCSSRGYQYAGLENGYNCYCDNTAPSGNTVNSAFCTTTCWGNWLENCGGNGYMTIYQSSSSVAAASSSSAAAASSSAAAAASSSKAAAAASSSAAAASASSAVAASSSSAAAAASSSAAAAASSSAAAAAASSSAAAASSSAAAAASSSKAAAAASSSAAAASASSAAAASSSAAAASASSAAAASSSAAAASASSAVAASSSSAAAAASSSAAAAASSSAAAAASSSAAAAASSSAAAAAASSSAAAASSSAAAVASSVAAAAAVAAEAAASSASVAALAAASSASVAAAAAASSASSIAAAAASSVSAAAAALATSIPSGWQSASAPCISEGTTGRALIGSSFSASNMTENSCIAYCESNGYTIAGLEYSSQCYCGSILVNGASLTKTSDACTMSCSGSSSSICGGSDALTLYVASSALNDLTSDLTSEIITLPSGWAAASTTCIAEGATGRALASASMTSDEMTVDMCVNYCSGLGWQYAGVEYGSECYCGDSLVNGASLSSTADCNMACSGDDASTCGGSDALQLYNNPLLALDLTIVNSFSHQGCIQEVSGRALTGASTSSDDMSIETCTAYCSASGFTYAGVEYGSECYCGNELVNGATSSLLSTECYMPCSGNALEICGGPDAITLYMA